MGYATQDAIAHFVKMHPEVSEEDARSLQANPDTSRPLYFWQLYSVLGTDRIVGIVQNLYTNIANDSDEPWLPKAFTRLSSWDHHVATQAAFWLDAMGKGKMYHGGEYRLHFHHHNNAHHIMTHQGAARWMHHMRRALDQSDLGSDPRVRGTIEDFLHNRMEKYAAQFSFQTGDRVYTEWHPEDWLRGGSWQLTGPEAKEPSAPKRCPITGQVGECESQVREVSTSGGSTPSSAEATSGGSTPSSAEASPAPMTKQRLEQRSTSRGRLSARGGGLLKSLNALLFKKT